MKIYSNINFRVHFGYLDKEEVYLVENILYEVFLISYSNQLFTELHKMNVSLFYSNIILIKVPIIQFIVIEC